MKKISIGFGALLTILMVYLFLGFKPIAGGSIRGQIQPVVSASKVQAVSATDTFNAVVVEGVFEIAKVKPGTYTVYIDAVSPFKSTMKSGVKVTEGNMTDMGVIQLESAER